MSLVPVLIPCLLSLQAVCSDWKALIDCPEVKTPLVLLCMLCAASMQSCKVNAFACQQIRRGVFQKHWLLAHLQDEPRHPGFYLVPSSACSISTAHDMYQLDQLLHVAAPSHRLQQTPTCSLQGLQTLLGAISAAGKIRSLGWL